MMRERWMSVVAAVAAAAVLGVPAAAQPGVLAAKAGVLVSADPAGDANFANSQNTVSGLEEGPSATPASLDGADLRTIRFSTAYTKTKKLRPDGTVAKVLYRSRALRIEIRTTGAMLPTFGPALYFNVPARVVNLPLGGSDEFCDFRFFAYLRSAVIDGPQVAEFVRSCDTSGMQRSPAFLLSVKSNVLTLEYPFGKLYFSDGARLVAQLGPIKINPYVRAVAMYHGGQEADVGNPHWYSVSPVIDEAPPISSFVVGSDVPADVVCSQKPAHPDCKR